MRALASLAALAVLLALLPGCPTPVGACDYRNSGGEEGTVEIVSVSAPEGEGQWAHVLVEVRGLFTRTISIPVADFTTCFGAPGYQVGSEVPAKVIYGGPCPPMDQLADCPPSG